MAVVELPAGISPVSIDDLTFVDFGMTLRPAAGASMLRINRPGTRLRLTVALPPMAPDVARRVWARLQEAKRSGLRIAYPLFGMMQGSPGSPVINGAVPTGTTLPLRGLTPGYALKEGYVMTLIDGDGRRYTHFARSAAAADASGSLSVTIEPPIRGVFADGDQVLLAKPTIEGVLTGDFSWSIGRDRLVRGAGITIEESAGVPV